MKRLYIWPCLTFLRQYRIIDIHYLATKESKSTIERIRQENSPGVYHSSAVKNGSKGGMRDILLISVVGCGSRLARGRPFLGILLFICLGLAGPQSMTWGMARTFPLGQLAALSTISGYVFWSETKKFPRQRELFLLLALWGIFCFS